MPHMQPQICENGCCPELPPIDCCTQEGLLVDVTLTLSDFDYPCSDAGPWVDGFGATWSEFSRQITLTDVAGTYTTQTTYDGCQIGDYSLEIGYINYRVFGTVKVRFFAQTLINHYYTDQRWTGLLKLERINGVTRFNLYDNVRTYAEVFYTRDGVLHDDLPSESRCLDGEFGYSFPPCNDPIRWPVGSPLLRYYMDLDEVEPNCYTQPDGNGGLVFVYEEGTGDVGFWLPDYAFSARGFNPFRPGNIDENHIAVSLTGLGWPPSTGPATCQFSPRRHLWSDALTYSIVPPP